MQVFSAVCPKAHQFMAGKQMRRVKDAAPYGGIP